MGTISTLDPKFPRFLVWKAPLRQLYQYRHIMATVAINVNKNIAAVDSYPDFFFYEYYHYINHMKTV